MTDRFFNWLVRQNRARQILVIATAVLVLISLVGIPTYAWFVQNLEVRQQTEMKIDHDNVTSLLFTAYVYDSALGKAKIVKGNDITLPQYDSVFTEKNEKATLVYGAPVFGPAIEQNEEFTITLSLKSIANTSQNNLYDSTGKMAKYISNVVYVKCYVVPDNPALRAIESAGNTDADTVYNTIHTLFASKTGQTFVTNTGTASSPSFSKPSTTMTFTISDYTSAKQNADDNILYVYFEIGYDEDLVSEIIKNESVTFNGGTGQIAINSDLNTFVFTMPDTD